MTTAGSPDDELLKSQVTKELEEAKALAKSFDFETVKNGEWFIKLLEQVVRAYDRNARATYFQHKYPGLSPDDIADVLTSVTARYATIAGAVAGVAASASGAGAIASGGMTAALFVGSIGAEMLYLSSIQMRLMLDMSVLYDLQLDPEDPEDILMVFGYALGVAPTEIVGKAALVAARAGTTSAIKKVVSKTTLKAVQSFAKKLGFTLLQRTIIKYAVPVACAAVGSGYNYVTTMSVGQIAKLHFKNRGRVTEELRAVVSRRRTYDLAVPAAAMFMAAVDGSVSAKENELYRAMLSRMSFGEYAPADFDKLISDEHSILEAISQIRDVELGKALIELLTLMAIYDGDLVDEEREFLTSAAEGLGIALDMDRIEERVKEYRVIVEKNVLEKTAGAMGSAAVGAIGAAGQAANRFKDALGEAANTRRWGQAATEVRDKVLTTTAEGADAARRFGAETYEHASEALRAADIDGAGLAIKGAAADAADAIGTGANRASSAIGGLATGAASALGDLLRRKQDAVATPHGLDSDTAGERPESPDA